MNRCFWLGVMVVSSCLVAGCGKVELEYVLNDSSKDQLADNPEALDQLATSLDEVFGTPAKPKLAKAIAAAVDAKVIVANEGDLETVGALKYRHWCMHCHGMSGDGNGPTAGTKENPFLNPRPRDYRIGRFKFTSTQGLPVIVKPTRADLLRTLRNGVPGTSMPSFALYDQKELESVLDYVILLSLRGETESKVVSNEYEPGGKITLKMVESTAKDVAESWEGLDAKVVQPKTPRPPATPESIAKGRELFLKKGECLKCHGPLALGDGWELDKSSDPTKQKDDWGIQAKPANLTLGVNRGGGRPIDLFRRIRHGVKGTPMAAQGLNLDEEETWHLVNYVRSIAYDGAEPKVAETPKTEHESGTKNN